MIAEWNIYVNLLVKRSTRESLGPSCLVNAAVSMYARLKAISLPLSATPYSLHTEGEVLASLRPDNVAPSSPPKQDHTTSPTIPNRIALSSVALVSARMMASCGDGTVHPARQLS